MGFSRNYLECSSCISRIDKINMINGLALANKELFKNRFSRNILALSIIAASFLILYLPSIQSPNAHNAKRYSDSSHQYELFTISDLVNFSTHNHSLKHHKHNQANANFIDNQDYERSRNSINGNHKIFIENVRPTSLKAKDRYQLFHSFNYNSPTQNAEKTELLLI